MPAEQSAYALARYSRSPDSIRDSIAWVRSHDSAKFLESFYFQYGHASIADLGHLTVCFEGISEIAAIEIEDEQLWDGQARSSRYQDFSQSVAIVPPELSAEEASTYRAATADLFAAYRRVKDSALGFLMEQLPRPDGMKPDAYRRNLDARAFDVARYLLPLGVPTGVGQVTSIRTLEKQISRLRVSEFEEVRQLGDELAQACAKPADCIWDQAQDPHPVAPTLARHAEPDMFRTRLHADLAEWAWNHLPKAEPVPEIAVDIMQPADHVADLCATLLYPVTDRPYRELYRWACAQPAARRKNLLQFALGSRGDHDELPRQFRSAPYVLDFVMDIGAFRDLHRHRRCYQFRQAYSGKLGFDTPELVHECGAAELYSSALQTATTAAAQLPQPAAHYALPFATMSRSLFKMDFAELAYVSKLRSGVKGHFSYRRIAWQMKEALLRLDPTLGELVDATPPWQEDLLTR